MGTVTGPGSSVVGNVVLWDNTTGTLVSDSGETLSLEGLSNVTYQTGGSPSNMIIGQQVTLASGATQNTFIGELTGPITGASTSTTSYNTAVGYNTMSALTSGSKNVALGNCLINLTTGANNVAVGQAAQALLTDGGENTAIGQDALFNNAHGNGNVAIGSEALLELSGNYNIGIGANTASSTVKTGSGNILYQRADEVTREGFTNG